MQSLWYIQPQFQIRRPSVMAITLYNSSTREKEKFVPQVEGQAGIYVCGPTVYGPPHLGHAKSYITFDVLVKHFKNSGYKTRYIQNITDVGHLTDNSDAGEDKIQKQARLDKVHPWEIVDKWTRQYMNDMERLHVAHPNFYVRASQHIPEQIEAIVELIEKGYAYEVDGNVYYSVEKFDNYGKLSGRVADEQQDAVRVQARGDKRNPRDFALWKKAEDNHILKWNSPWGTGYPGWHIECSVMANKYLGETIDIHGGGIENKFPHHECEIAQSEALNGKPFCRYWVHNNMVTVDGIKMGKSLGNFVTCEDLLNSYSPEAIRAFILSTHYRSPSNYTHDAIEAASSGLNRLERAKEALIEIINQNISAKGNEEQLTKLKETFDQQINERLDDDIDTPGAIAKLYELVVEINKHIAENSISSQSATELLSVITHWGTDILGIVSQKSEEKSQIQIEPIMQVILDLRKEMKQTKKFDVSDSIRDKMKEAGIAIEDTKDGMRWRYL